MKNKERTKLEHYKKSEERVRYENEELTLDDYEKEVILKPIKKLIPKASSGRARHLTLPQYISFTIKDKKLCLNIEEQEGVCNGEKVIENATCKNMQSDNAAFEGWAICLKAWLPEKIETVELKWDVPHDIDEKDNKWCHYRRFLYRVLRFSEQYDWFIISPDNSLEVDNLKNILDILQNNSFSKLPDRKGDLNKLGETAVE